MKKILLMTAIMGLVFTTVQTNAQVVQRTDRRMVQEKRNNYVTANDMRKANQLRKELREVVLMANADGYITPRESKVINRKKRELDRIVYMQQNKGYVRR